MTNEKVSCKVTTTIKNMSCELKVAYILILLLLISNIIIISKLCCDKFNNKLNTWVDQNPKIILNSVQKYIEKEQTAAQQKQMAESSINIKKNIDEIRDEKNTGVYNPKGTKIIVEFFDYNCHFCKQAAKSLEEVIATEKNVKIIFRELPILGEASVTAAKYGVAVAIAEPNKYFNFYTALFNNGASTEDDIKNALKTANISVDKIQRIMKTKAGEIEDRIKQNTNIAMSIGLRGTPAIVIGENLLPGAVDANTIKSKL